VRIQVAPQMLKDRRGKVGQCDPALVDIVSLSISPVDSSQPIAYDQPGPPGISWNLDRLGIQNAPRCLRSWKAESGRFAHQATVVKTQDPVAHLRKFDKAMGEAILELI
jgi:hypothetical protein